MDFLKLRISLYFETVEKLRKKIIFAWNPREAEGSPLGKRGQTPLSCLPQAGAGTPDVVFIGITEFFNGLILIKKLFIFIYQTVF